MDKYNNFEVEDFAGDENFMAWVLTPNQQQNEFWTNWLQAHPEKQEHVARARNILLSLKPKSASSSLSESEIDAISNRIQQSINIDEQGPVIRKLSGRLWLRVAAVLLVVFTLGALLFRNKYSTAPMVVNNQNAYVNYVNNGAQPKIIVLGDSSLVVLKPKSSLRYPRTFAANERKVELTGEAFFEVHKNHKWPFLVYSKMVITRVLGTSFTVKAFPGKEAQVTVNTGKVQVTRKDANNKILSEVILLPNEEASTIQAEVQLQKKSLKVPLMLSQPVANKVFSFTEAPLSEIVEKLEQAYHVPINYDHEKYAHATVTASLSKLPLDEKIRMICKAIDAECDMADGVITIK